MLGNGPLGSAPLAGPPRDWFLQNFAARSGEESRYFEAFGRFVASYGLAEAGMHIALRYVSGLSDEAARIVFKDIPISGVTGRLLALTNVGIFHDNFIEIDRQFKSIGQERNQLVHRLVTVDSAGLNVTNRLTSSSELVHPKTFDLQDLLNMEFDCRVIFGRTVLGSGAPMEQHLVGRDLGIVDLIGPLPAWRYKPIHGSKPRRHIRQPRR